MSNYCNSIKCHAKACKIIIKQKILIASCALLATSYATQTVAKNLAQAAAKSRENSLAQCDYGGYGARINKITITDFTCPRDDCGRVCYDNDCEYLRDYDALRNPVMLRGPKVVTVNLDERIQVVHLTREGVFLDLGDILFVTGRENDNAVQAWLNSEYLGIKDCDIRRSEIEFVLNKTFKCPYLIY